MMGAVARPTIGIIGTGAIGGFYGVMLARAGFAVHCLLRSEFSTVADHGLRVDRAPPGVLTLNPVQAYSDAQDMPPCDWLLVGAKTTSNADLAPAILQAASACDDGRRSHTAMPAGTLTASSSPSARSTPE